MVMHLSYVGAHVHQNLTSRAGQRQALHEPFESDPSARGPC
jgi:hypothetical protein